MVGALRDDTACVFTINKKLELENVVASICANRSQTLYLVFCLAGARLLFQSHHMYTHTSIGSQLYPLRVCSQHWIDSGASERAAIGVFAFTANRSKINVSRSSSRSWQHTHTHTLTNSFALRFSWTRITSSSSSSSIKGLLPDDRERQKFVFIELPVDTHSVWCC